MSSAVLERPFETACWMFVVCNRTFGAFEEFCGVRFSCGELSSKAKNGGLAAADFAGDAEGAAPPSKAAQQVFALLGLDKM